MKKFVASVLFCGAAAMLAAQSKYEGPKPDKPDLPFLRHAAKLIPLETGQAKDDNRKNEQWAVVSGSSSTVRTPLAEPFFIMEMGKIDPKTFELYRVETKGGQREVMISRKQKQGTKPLKIMVSPLGDRLYRIDVNETLENGDYCLSPAGSNTVFCFNVY